MKINVATRKINKIITSLFLTMSLLLAPVSASALSFTPSYFASSGSKAACATLKGLNSGETCGSSSSTTVNNLISTIINILTYIVGIVTVVMIIISGLRFVTSGGDSQKVAAAKTALIYALIGLIVVALAQAIIHFVINTSVESVPKKS